MDHLLDMELFEKDSYPWIINFRLTELEED